MKHLFTPEGLEALAAVVRAEPLLAFDFDGTLAPIVEHPDDAAVGAAVAAPLAALAARLPVAIVTGRSIGDVTPRLGFAARWVIGNHGAEGLGDIGAADSADRDRPAPLHAPRRRTPAPSTNCANACAPTPPRWPKPA